MGDESNSEKILREYIISNIQNYSLEDIEKKAISSGYSEETFRKVFGSIDPSLISQNNENHYESYSPSENEEPFKTNDRILVSVEKTELDKIIKRTKKKSFFKPTKITGYTFLIIFVIVVIYSFFTSFSFGVFNLNESSNNISENILFEIGYPKIFFTIFVDGEDNFLVEWKYLVLDFLIYILISYLLDLILSNSYDYLKNRNKSSKKIPLYEAEKNAVLN